MAEYWPDGAPRVGGLEDVLEDPYTTTQANAADMEYATLLRFAEFLGRDESAVQGFIHHSLGDAASGYLARRATVK